MNHFIVDGRYKEILNHHGIDIGEVLKKAKLPGDIFSHKTITMKEEQYYSFLSAIDSVVKIPGLAVILATTDNIENFSPPIFASYCSKNGKVCIERLAKYKKLIGPMCFHVVEQETETMVEFLPGEEQLELPRFVVESEIAFLINMIRKATKEEIVPTKITARMVLEGDAIENFAGVKPEIGNHNAVYFSNHDLLEPFISYNDGMWDYFEPELKRRLSDLDVDDSTSARVRSALVELLPGGASGIEDVAEKLGLSRRTLQRKLAEENTTFQKQLNNTREVLALHYINNTDMTTNDIAYLLGYAELNSFLRAFHVWTGMNISEYKKK